MFSRTGKKRKYVERFDSGYDTDEDAEFPDDRRRLGIYHKTGLNARFGKNTITLDYEDKGQHKTPFGALKHFEALKKKHGYYTTSKKTVSDLADSYGISPDVFKDKIRPGERYDFSSDDYSDYRQGLAHNPSEEYGFQLDRYSDTYYIAERYVKDGNEKRRPTLGHTRPPSRVPFGPVKRVHHIRKNKKK